MQVAFTLRGATLSGGEASALGPPRGAESKRRTSPGWWVVIMASKLVLSGTGGSGGEESSTSAGAACCVVMRTRRLTEDRPPTAPWGALSWCVPDEDKIKRLASALRRAQFRLSSTLRRANSESGRRVLGSGGSLERGARRCWAAKAVTVARGASISKPSSSA